LHITGNNSGVVDLAALQSGPYTGMVYFQNRAATEDVEITGNGTFNITGTIYAANATLDATGNGNASGIGSQIIARQVSLGGNGSITVSYNSGNRAMQRQLSLVE
jgi:hypothetical protein